MRTIWKYDLDGGGGGTAVIAIPTGAIFLDAQFQSGRLVLWALVDPAAPKTDRKVAVMVTGGDIPGDENLFHIATGQLFGGSFVYHVFEVLS